MLIRVIINNVLSFGKETEFNLFPSPRYSRLAHHKYTINGFDILKSSAIYGANGAGKSNLIKAIIFLQQAVLMEKIPPKLANSTFKFAEEVRSQILGIEFFYGNSAYYYAVETQGTTILTEELYHSGLGKKEDTLIYERNRGVDGQTHLNFFPEFEQDPENRSLRKILEKQALVKADQPMLKILAGLENAELNSVKEAYLWFQNCLQIINPDTKIKALPIYFEDNAQLYRYAQDLIQSLGIGIRELSVESKALSDDELTIDNFQEIKNQLDDQPNLFVALENRQGKEVVIVKDDDQLIVKRLILKHQGDLSQPVNFYLDEESDGTKRLLDYLPLFYDVSNRSKIYIVDEIERSIHPLLIKELIRKFSENVQTKGQLIFTTHESNLLDQSILRQDEIWFAEKDKQGCTSFFPLSEFKEHHTKDVSKGYLNGRYGAVPFLGNLQDLNWNQYALTE